MSPGAIVVARGLRKVYPDGTLAVDGVSFAAGPGISIFMGPNGSGKTTTLAMIAGALKPTSGTVEVCGYDMWGSDWSKPRACVGYAPQNTPFREKLTVLENLVWYALIRGIPLGEAKARALTLLGEVGLLDASRKKVAELSGGMRRRLAIAASLIGDPQVLVLDEPTSGLDPAARESLWRLLHRLADKGKTLIVSTHIPEEAEEHADTVYIFHRGRIVASGRPEYLVRQHARSSRIIVEGSRLPRTITVNGVTALDADDRRIILVADDPDMLLPRILEDLLSRGARIERVEVRKPGLAEAYLNLTGESPYARHAMGGG